MIRVFPHARTTIESHSIDRCGQVLHEGKAVEEIDRFERLAHRLGTEDVVDIRLGIVVHLRPKVVVRVLAHLTVDIVTRAIVEIAHHQPVLLLVVLIRVDSLGHVVVHLVQTNTVRIVHIRRLQMEILYLI